MYYQQFPERAFPSIVNASHILGYVKEVDKEIRNSLKDPAQYELGDIIGWSGLEKMYEKSLKGLHGIQFYQEPATWRFLLVRFLLASVHSYWRVNHFCTLRS